MLVVAGDIDRRLFVSGEVGDDLCRGSGAGAGNDFTLVLSVCERAVTNVGGLHGIELSEVDSSKIGSKGGGSSSYGNECVARVFDGDLGLGVDDSKGLSANGDDACASISVLTRVGGEKRSGVGTGDAGADCSGSNKLGGWRGVVVSVGGLGRIECCVDVGEEGWFEVAQGDAARSVAPGRCDLEFGLRPRLLNDALYKKVGRRTSWRAWRRRRCRRSRRRRIGGRRRWCGRRRRWVG